MDGQKNNAELKVFHRNFGKFSDEENAGSHFMLNSQPFASIVFLGSFLIYKLVYFIYVAILKRREDKKITRTQIS